MGIYLFRKLGVIRKLRKSDGLTFRNSDCLSLLKYGILGTVGVNDTLTISLDIVRSAKCKVQSFNVTFNLKLLIFNYYDI
jgi:hypothetical protein